jgi:hypothetical protein
MTISGRWCGVLGLALASACSNGTEPHVITVSVSVQPPLALPGDTIQVTATAVPTGGVTVQQIRITLNGLITAMDQVPVSGSGSQSVTRAYLLPFQPAAGTVTVVATAEGGGTSGSAQAIVSVADAVKPVVSGVSAYPTALQPGDMITVGFTASDNVGLAYTVVRVSGAVTGIDSLDEGLTRSITRSARFQLPGTAHVGDVVRIEVIAADEGLLRDSVADAPLTVTDVTPPVVSGSIAGPESTLTFVAGDTLRLTVNGSDNVQLGWIGYRISGFGLSSVDDSIAVSTPVAAHDWALIVQSAWVGNVSVLGFARDSVGHLAEHPLNVARVLPGMRRPTRTAPLSSPVSDVVYSQPRDALYLSQPSLDRVAVLTLGSFTFGTPIALFSQPRGLDLSVGGDTLVVALRNSHYLALVNLTSGQVDTVRLAVDNSYNLGPDHVRVMGNNKALVTLTFDGSGYGGQVWEFDLGAGTQRRRTDVGIGGQVTEAVPLARAGDRSRLFFLIDDSCCPEEGDEYFTATDTIGIKRGTANGYFSPVSTTASGSLFLIGASLFDDSLRFTQSYSPPVILGRATAISPDGLSIYMAKDSGYVKLRASDGAMLEQVRLPVALTQMFVLPTGDWLVGLTSDPFSGPGKLVVVDLR